jgi:hypothetical protein
MILDAQTPFSVSGGHFCEKFGVFLAIFGTKRHRRPTAYATK